MNEKFNKNAKVEQLTKAVLSHGEEIGLIVKDPLFKKTFSFRKHFGTVLIEEIRIAKFCTEVFVMPKYLMTKRNIPKPSLYMSPLRTIVLSQQHCRITLKW